jgi:glycosyltransferase involved in cell wall biosynthesis
VLLRGSLLCREFQPELIYSTGGPASAHFAAAFISSWHGIPWIAEFQDPLVCNDWPRSGRSLKVSTWLERFVCARANFVIFLTREAMERASGRTGLGVRGKVIYPGAETAGKSPVHYLRGEFCRFAHFGSLGGSRNLKVLLEGLNLLFDELPELADLIRLDIFGTCDQLSRNLVKKFAHSEVITDFGRLPRKESIAAMVKSDVLLLIQNTEEFSAETIPSKVYEYLHTGRPVLGLVYRNTELTELLIGLGHRAVDAASAMEVKNGIVQMVEQWRTGGGIPQPSPYTVEAAVDSLICIAAQLHGRASTDTAHG